MISVTDKAVAKIKEISEAEGIGHFNIRIRIMGGGCAGFSYDVYYEDKPSDLDEVEQVDGVSIIIDPLSIQYLDGVEIDYVEETLSSGFKFNNPNVSGSCGCGSSVAF
jgi:iron-sulfur cluster insertion protein